MISESPFLTQMVEVLISTASFGEILNNMVCLLARNLKVDLALYFGLDKARETLWLNVSSQGPVLPHLRLEFPMGQGLVGESANTRKLSIVHRHEPGVAAANEPFEKLHPTYQTLAAFPVADDQFLYGVLILVDRTERSFTATDRQAVQLPCRMFASALRQAIVQEEAKKRIEELTDSEPYILRSIEFSPEHHETGMTILNYFGTLLRQKYPGMKVKVKIEQEDLMVRMIIQTEEGNIEKIEKTLGEYGLVIKGEMPLEEFLSNPFEILQLKNQIKIAYLQLENQKELLGLQKSLHGERITELEEEVKWLRSHVANILISSQNNVKAIEEVMREARKLLESRDEILESAISLIDKKLQEGVTQDDLALVKQALEIIQDRSPSFFEQFIEKINLLIIQGSISGVAGNLLYDLLKSFSKMC